MKIAVIHNRVRAEDAPDARDVLQQAEEVIAALASLGHQVVRWSCGLDLEEARRALAGFGPDLVFNLVEDLAGHGRLIHLFPSLLDALRIPYTGAPAEAIFLTSHKTLAKERMQQAGLPTPAWAGPWPVAGRERRPSGWANKWIIKSLWEHASVGLDAGSVLATDSAATLSAEMRRRCDALGGSCFAEEFIDGREFNLSLLAGADGPEVLPPAEILFSGYTPDMIRIVDYQAKWDEGSLPYRNTPRTFDFGPADAPLLQELTDIARRCWHAFALAGYARVDFRVDGAGRPFILEINTNPCLSPDAGFAAALAQAGISFAQAMARIVADARRNPPQSEK
ncbi:MAG TPA: D-alanine--D-alanine ligase [Desulfobulbaceae bacterium]|nr:D-alanine--D-alanine ligase [Desulfobulbaceae bacterium]